MDNKLLSEEKENQKEQLILKLEQDVTELEDKINNVKTQNKMIRRIRNIKIARYIITCAAPFIAAATVITYCGSALGGGLPFKMDKQKKYLYMQKTIDTEDNIATESQYGSFNRDNEFSVYGKWSRLDDGTYQRTIIRYFFDGLDEEHIEKIINSEINNVTYMLGEPTTVIETKKNISTKELQEEGYVQAIIYSVDKGDYILIEEKFDSNFCFTMAELSFFIVIVKIIKKIRGYKLNDKIIETLEQNQIISIDEKVLRKKLQIRKNNIDRFNK